MIKKILLTFVVLLIAIAAGAFLYLDSIVTRGIEVVGSRVLGTNVTVDSVALSPLGGQGSIADLRIANPAGFNADHVFELGYISLSLDVSSVFNDVITIESITIAQPVITYETRITTDNIRALLANLPASGDGNSSSSTDTGTSKQVVIRELIILNPQLTLSAGLVSAPIQLPDLVLRDIGTDLGAVSIAEALRVILSALRASILQADLPNLDLLRDSIENSVQETTDQTGRAIDDAVDNLGNRLRGLRN